MCFVFTNSILSGIMFATWYHFPARIHCLYTYLLKYYYRNILNDKYRVINNNNMWLMLSTAWIFGTIFINLERSPTKRTDIAIFAFWKSIEHTIRWYYKIETRDRDDTHPILGNIKLSALLFGLACSIAVFVQLSNPKALKSLERGILNYFIPAAKIN